MLSRILAVGLLLSLGANGVAVGLYYRAKAETQTLVSQAALAANQHWKATAFAMDAAHEAEVTELRSRLALSDQVTKQALARARESEQSLSDFERSLKVAALAQPDYAKWAETELPVGVADRLRDLQ